MNYIFSIFFIGLVVSVSFIIWLSTKIGQKGALQKAALQADLGEAISSPTHEELVGKEGIARTVLRPSGKVLIQGRLFDAISEYQFVEEGERVVVTKCENAQLYVVRTETL